MAHTAGLSASNHWLRLGSWRESIRSWRVVTHQWFLELQGWWWQRVSAETFLELKYKWQYFTALVSVFDENKKSNKFENFDCRYWLNLCQSIGKSPDNTKCPRGAAACWKKDGEVQMLGTVESQTMSFGTLCCVHPYLTLHARIIHWFKKCDEMTVANWFWFLKIYNVVSGCSSRLDCFLIFYTTQRMINSWWNIPMVTMVPVLWGNEGVTNHLLTLTFTLAVGKVLEGQKSCPSKRVESVYKF